MGVPRTPSSILGKARWRGLRCRGGASWPRKAAISLQDCAITAHAAATCSHLLCQRDGKEDTEDIEEVDELHEKMPQLSIYFTLDLFKETFDYFCRDKSFDYCECNWGTEFEYQMQILQRGGPALDVQGVRKSMRKIMTEETDEWLRAAEKSL